MSKAMNRLSPWIAGAALVLSITACSDDSPNTLGEAPENPAATLSANPSGPMEPSAGATEQTFDGAGMTPPDTITANNMEILIPAGIRIPESTLVTEALPASIMMADEDPAAVTDMVTASAAAAGYEVYAETPSGKVFVGEGTAVMLTAGPMAQMLTWGPEAMKDVLAGG